MKTNVGDKIKILRKNAKMTQKELAEILDTSASAVGMYEQNRREPDIETLIKLSLFFRVSCDYLLGITNAPKVQTIPFSEHEQDLITAYRSQPDIQSAVDRLLGIDNDEKVLLWSAASSADNSPSRIIYIEKDRWEKIKSAPETDDPLV